MRPLEGVTILDLSSNIAGPLATLTLSRLGAQVIKVERPGGDPSRAWSPKVDDVSLVFDTLNRGKQSIALNLSDPGGRRVLEQLVAHCQVVVHNFTPDVAMKLSLTEDDLRVLNTDIIYCNVGAFGSGPFGARLPGYDGVAQAFTGIMEMTGAPGSPPTRCAPAVVDVGTGQWLVISILAALLSASTMDTRFVASKPRWSTPPSGWCPTRLQRLSSPAYDRPSTAPEARWVRLMRSSRPRTAPSSLGPPASICGRP